MTVISASTSETYVLIYSLPVFHYHFLNCHICTYDMIMSVIPTNYHFYEKKGQEKSIDIVSSIRGKEIVPNFP